ncbi:MAG: aldo/keto reductase [Deltaproteobacteria bacterium]|nr:aldo/keto reductase [Deltaproteobacteria bacterium]MBI2181561.1 aldo/keto reductase [Deltaproteobacteria bacterium]MBI2230497.1 aldo/keto reductase [Deltaproteobacteria bacterium]MBI2368357.1 aldo/keto reductase [Deltaproteobacteria bacterium]MBI2535265.1 aldo/keto reductase [Deltaproteobacteria bacterium]
MEKRRLGKTDMVVSVLGFGGSEIGYERASSSTVKKLLNRALDAGLNVIDTAECYVTSEELIGAAVGARRGDYYLFTKCGHERGWSYPDWRPESLLRSVERSLKRLKTDYVDLVQLHSCSEAELRKGHTIDALKRARERGHTRYIGYSGDSAAALYAVECGEFDTLQISVSLADQEALERILPSALARSMGVIAKRPLANIAWHNGSRPPDDFYGRTYWERLQKLRYEFLEGDLKMAAATALRFTLSVPGLHTAIVGTAKPGRFMENAAALEEGPLPKETFHNIRARWREVAQASWTGQT